MAFERDHINPQVQRNLEHARALRHQFLRQWWFRKSKEWEAVFLVQAVQPVARQNADLA
jgi:hypothetical protein